MTTKIRAENLPERLLFEENIVYTPGRYTEAEKARCADLVGPTFSDAQVSSGSHVLQPEVLGATRAIVNYLSIPLPNEPIRLSTQKSRSCHVK